MTTLPHPNQFRRVTHAERTALARARRPERPILRVSVVVPNRNVSHSTQQPWHVRVSLAAVRLRDGAGGAG